MDVSPSPRAPCRQSPLSPAERSEHARYSNAGPLMLPRRIEIVCGDDASSELPNGRRMAGAAQPGSANINLMQPNHAWPRLSPCSATENVLIYERASPSAWSTQLCWFHTITAPPYAQARAFRIACYVSLEIIRRRISASEPVWPTSPSTSFRAPTTQNRSTRASSVTGFGIDSSRVLPRHRRGHSWNCLKEVRRRLLLRTALQA